MKPISKLIIFLVIYFFNIGKQNVRGEHPDSYLTITELIEKYGYPFEEHEVTTSDNYILTIFRIPHGYHGSGVNRKPILLMHGMFGQAENFIINGMNNGSLAYILADNNFDVWLGNTRGTHHGRKHKILDPKNKDFWDFSFHEMGVFDLPAQIDYILKTTKKKKLYYVGHSQGGTAFYIMCSLKPEYQKKIVLSSLLSPGGYEKNFKHPMLLQLAKNVKELTDLADTLNLFEIPPKGWRLNDLGRNTCREGMSEICAIILHISSQGEPPDKDLLALLLRFLASVSTKQVLHYAQAIDSGKIIRRCKTPRGETPYNPYFLLAHLRPWDYGPETNEKWYGAIEPPDYPVKNITVPTAMYYSLGDYLAFAQDIEDICDDMKNCVRKFLLPNKRFGHLDFLISRTVTEQVYEPLLTFAQKYDKVKL